MQTVLRLASRKSDLARVQAYAVGAQLEAADPNLRVEYIFRESLGDRQQADPLWKMPEKGVFTEDFRLGLIRREFDLVVHSWKDLPIVLDGETKVVATLPRADARDCFWMPEAAWEKVKSTGRLRVLTSSPRRTYNLETFLKDALPKRGLEIEFIPVRGNVPTRVRKLFAGEGDALILAKAALDRLLTAEREEFRESREELRARLGESRWMILPVSVNPPAAAQGALAVEIASGRPELEERLRGISSAEDFSDVAVERKILASYGGGCHQKIGVHRRTYPFGRVTSLRGLTDDGRVLREFSLEPLRKGRGSWSPFESWPASSDDEIEYFHRQNLDVENPGCDLIVARSNALPEDWRLARGQVVWTSGRRTWIELAKRGVWVNGTFDGLGESDPGISVLLGREPNFAKLSHTEAPIAGEVRVVATYKLEAQDNFPDLRRYQNFYWKSASLFLAALRRFPELRERSHASGPGHTWRKILATIGDPTRVRAYLSIEDWRKDLLE